MYPGRLPPGWQFYADKIDTEGLDMKGALAVPEQGFLAHCAV